MSKKFLAALLAVLMVVTMVPMTALAADETYAGAEGVAKILAPAETEAGYDTAKVAVSGNVVTLQANIQNVENIRLVTGEFSSTNAIKFVTLTMQYARNNVLRCRKTGGWTGK